MTSHQFVFPPPPPPPPQTQSSYHNPAGPHNSWNNGRGNRSDHRRGQSGFNRGSRGGLRGGARGGLRGGPRGGSRGGSHCLYHTGFDSRPTNSPGHSHPLPQYPLGQQFHYLAAPQNHVHPTLAYSPAPGVDVGVEYHDDTQRQVQFYSVQQDGTSYKYNFPNQNAPYDPQQAPQYVPVAPLQDNQYPTLIRGPPIRMGFGANDYTAGDQHVQAQHQIQPHPISSGVHHLQHGPGSIMPSSFRAVSQTPLNITRYDSPNPFPDQRTCGQKRQHDGIAGQRRHKNKTSAEVKTKVAPAVPSFGKPLPVSLPPSQETEERPKRKKRRHNQLGLTPKSLEYESSEDENDVDEEVKLANAAGLPSSDRLQFSYKGRTSTLQSFADIAAWIQERKNRFPTKARVEKQKENQRQLKTSQQAKRQALKESTKPKQLAKPVEKQKQTTEVKEEAESKDGEMECAVTAEAAKSKAKLEKLRKELRKQEKRIAKAEAKASRLDSEANKYQPGGLVPPIATGATIIKRSDGDRPDKELQEIKLEVVSQATFTAPTSAPHEDCSSNKAGGNDGGTDNRIESTENEDSKPNNIKVPIDISPEVPLDTSKLTSEKTDDKSTREKAIAENHDIKLEDVELPIEPCTLSLQVGSSSTKNGEEAGSGVDNSILKEDNASAASIINPLTPISQPSPICKEGELHSEQNAQPHEITSALPSAQPASDPQDYILYRFDNRSISSIDSLSTTDSEDDITSSSGSSSSSSSSSTPEAQPVRRALAEREPPIKRRQNQQAKNICHSFFNNRGFCRKGQRCRYRHELPEGRTIGQSTKKNNSIREQGGKNQRISLYQRLVDQEVKQEQDEKRQKEESAPIKKEEGN